VLHQLEKDEGKQYPAAMDVLSTQTYVDDIITGTNTVDKVLMLQQQTIQLLAHGGFVLKKWASNRPEVLKNIPMEDRTTVISFDQKDECTVKILGLHWDPRSDTFTYHSGSFKATPTKRSVLSAIAQMYDPPGLLAPIIFWAKCFMQTLWKSEYTWDQPISNELSSSWKTFSSELPSVASLKIPRYIPIDQSCHVQLLGFSDASKKGFAAVVYIRLEYPSKLSTVHLLTAKSKVAPLKSGNMNESLSIPRLELCGALLLAQTLHRVQQTLAKMVHISSMHAWTDSTVVLAWITTHQVQFKVFVTNRLNKIVKLIPSCTWRHVSTLNNPADCVSRGMHANEALSHTLYWTGPEFLRQPESGWSSTVFNVMPLDRLPERQIPTESSNLVTVPTLSTDWLQRFSSFTRVTRIVAHMYRFICRIRNQFSYSGFIRWSELEHALKIIVKVTQSHEFRDLIKTLSCNRNGTIPLSVARLTPFLDTEGIVRVGGRIRNSMSKEDFKFPILLPKSCVLFTLLVRHYHTKHLHAGPQLVSFLLSVRFWILSSRSIIRSVIFKCVVCAKQRATRPTPVTGDLPNVRVCPSRSFNNVGIDYAGPLWIKEGRRRNTRSVKCYLAIFVCMAIKAVHIEVVSDLSTPAFIAALHRFISRRGIPAHIYSDCGTNFQGADAVLRTQLRDLVVRELCSTQIPCQWHFNPPAAPHFGGLWEAAVKSTKYHLKRVIGTQLLTFEEMSTLAHRIEALLISRPLVPQSSDPGDLRVLTPGDFLIGCPLVALPEPDLTSTPMNRLSRWQLLTQFQQSFWKRWSSEYLTTLQGRSKWYRKQVNIAIGDLVIVHHPKTSPTHW